MPQSEQEKPRERSKGAKIGDCVIILILVLIGVLIEFQGITINPNQLYIPGLDEATDTITNYNYDYPDIEQVIGTTTLMLMITLPWYALFIISVICLYIIDKQFNKDQVLTHLYLMTRMIVFCFSVCLITVDLMKLFVGSPRPYFIDIYERYKLDQVDKQDMVDARLSFPSGHAGYSWSQLFLLTIMFYNSWKYTQEMYYTQTQIPIGMKTDNPHSYYLCGFWWLLRDIPLLSIILVFVPTYLAIYCSLTRITDYKHFAADIVGGALIGGCIAYISYLVFYNEMYLQFNYKLKVEIGREYANKLDHNTNGSKNGNKDGGDKDNKSMVVPLSVEDTE